jgi:CP family cyanate transporter-like MFS transporter
MNADKGASGRPFSSLAASLLLLWLAGLCLRLTVLCVPPVIPLIRDSFPLTQANVAALTSLPVLLFCVAAIPGSLMISRWGAGRILVAGILVTGLASAARAASPDLAMLFGTTFVMGIGIAVMQPAFPAIVREWVPQRVALGTAVYSNALLVGEALAASLTIPVVVPLAGGWRGSLVAWSGLVLVLGIVLVFAVRGARGGNGVANPRWWPDWREGATWRLGLIMGFASSLYFGTNAFLPDLVRWHGRSP